MIIPDFLVLNEKGLYCLTGKFYLDPQEPVELAIVSHAHGDHAVKGHQTVHATAATLAIMQLRYAKNAGKQLVTHAYHEQFNINGVNIRFIPAGHIIGSAQVLLEYDGTTYLYTGDVKLQEDSTCEPAEFCKADVLITETTFADPSVTHPDPATEIGKLGDVKFNILLGAYSLGKSQRLISLLNRYCPAKKILVHHSILSVNRVYESFDFPPGKYEPYNRKLLKESGSDYIYIVPPLTFNSYFRAKNVLRVFASGWKRLQQQNDLELLVSDHADWHDILEIIRRVQPTEIWTLHGDGRHLEAYFRDRLQIKLLNKC